MVYNPVIGNPPLAVKRMMPPGSKFIGQISGNVHAITYTHADDLQDYVHDFEDDPGVSMFAIENADGTHAVLVVGNENQDIWQEF